MSVVEQGARRGAVAALSGWLEKVAPRSARGEVTVAVVSDARVRALNQRYRRIDKTTDVLSFPAEKTTEKKGSGGFSAQSLRKTHPAPFSPPPFLGEIVISRGIAQKQAKKLGHPYKIELRVLALHGLLHLLGYDHEVDDGQMARLETRLRRKAGLPAGLIARSS